MSDPMQSLAEINAAVDSAIDELNGSMDPTDEQVEETPEIEGEQLEAEEAPEVEEATLTESQQKAADIGWVPKHKFKGNPEDWVDADEFMRQRPIRERLSAQYAETKSLKKRLDAVIKYQTNLEQKVREKVIAEFEAKKKEAVKFGDVEAYEAADQELKKVAAEELPKFDEEEEAKPVPEIPDFVQKFAKDNPWFETDPDMQAVMVRRTEILTGQGMELQQAIGEALKHVKATFPSKFANPNKSKPPPVMSGNREARPQSGSKRTMASLSHEERSVYHSLKGVMTEKQFLDSLEA